MPARLLINHIWRRIVPSLTSTTSCRALSSNIDLMGRRKTKLVVQAVNSATVTEIRSRKRVKIEDTLTVEVSEPQKQARDAIIEAAEAPATPAAKRKTLKKLKETGFSAEQLPTLQVQLVLTLVSNSDLLFVQLT